MRFADLTHRDRLPVQLSWMASDYMCTSETIYLLQRPSSTKFISRRILYLILNYCTLRDDCKTTGGPWHLSNAKQGINLVFSVYIHCAVFWTKSVLIFSLFSEFVNLFSMSYTSCHFQWIFSINKICTLWRKRILSSMLCIWRRALWRQNSIEIHVSYRNCAFSFHTFFFVVLNLDLLLGIW